MNFSVFQLIDALDFGDAVSNHCLEISKILSNNKYNNRIFSKYAHEKMMDFRKDIKELKVNKNDIVIFHFSGKSNFVNLVKALNCKKILIYHNITPHSFFVGMEPHYTHCLEGRQQLADLVGQFEYYLGDSEFNVEELIALGCSPTGVLPIFVDIKVKEIEHNRNAMRTLKSTAPKFLFVGRVAPNKKHEDVMKVFEYYYTFINRNASLYFVGNYESYQDYYASLYEYKSKLLSRDQIVFTGKVSQSELEYHYQTADIFISMSEHEGFCVPLLESIAYGIPTLAYNAGAIKSTMGNSGVIINEKIFDNIAELIDLILSNSQLSTEIIEKQYNWINNFSVKTTEECLLRFINEVKKC